MRILMVNTLYHPHGFGGAEESVRVLAEALAAQGHRVTVASTAPSALAPRERAGVRCRYVPLRNFFWPFDGKARPGLAKTVFKIRDLHNPPMIRAIGALVEAEQPDVVHTNNLAGFSTGVWGAAFRSNVPVVHTLRDYALMCPRTTMFKNGEACAGQCRGCAAFSSGKRLQSRKVGAVVGISDAVLKRHVDNGYFAGHPRARVIPNGCAAAPARARRARTGPLRFGYLSRLSPEKGIEALCEAFLSLPAGEDAALVVGGKGAPPFERALRDRYASARVEFRGHQDRGTFLAGVDVLVVPSLWPEPAGRVVLEAYAHGVPVVVADRGGLPEAVAHERTGLIYDPADGPALGRALLRLTREPALFERLRRGASEQAAAYEPGRVAARYADVYGETLRSTHSEPRQVACPLA